MKPITREETFLAKAAGQDVKVPKPITRVEMFLKNLIDHISEIGSGGTGGGGSGGTSVAQPDWDAAEGEPGHILNRTHYTEMGMKTIFSATDMTTSEEDGAFILETHIPLIAGEEYVVNWNGTDYVCTAQEYKTVNTETGEEITLGIILGNIELVEDTGDNGMPFALLSVLEEYIEMVGVWGMIYTFDGSTSLTISISGKAEIVHPIPEKYMPTRGGVFYGDSDFLYKTEDTSDKTNMLLKAELEELVKKGIAIYVAAIYDDTTVYRLARDVSIAETVASVLIVYDSGQHTYMIPASLDQVTG